MAGPLNQVLPGTNYPMPAMRRLRIYAFDPQASIELDTAVINDAVIELPWEKAWEDPLDVGPINEYLEVIDYDPACGLFYAPVDLNHPRLLAQDGLPPAEGRPQFHQQMVFAVAMKTIRIFERALGRPVMWVREAPTGMTAEDQIKYFQKPDSRFVKKLRIYPHALREANAYYSPDKCALLFGYFRKDGEGGLRDDGWVFTALSQDIIAHETTHAILHGMHRRSIEPSSADTLAFHEGFADIVALFQHFAMTNVVEHQLKRAGGSLRNRGLLTGLANQFGHATGRRESLRYALDMILDEMKPGEPVKRLSEAVEPHERGQFLVAAVFDAFVTIYERRTEDLMRLAGKTRPKDGRGQVDGDLSPDLVTRLAAEARKAADHILRMCVRALDYIPPVDLQFGEYLRAIVTADADLVPDDPMRYRVAIAEAFRNRGIFVPGAISMAPDSLMWEEPDVSELPGFDTNEILSKSFASVLSELELAVDFGRTAPKKEDWEARERERRGRARDIQQAVLMVTGYELEAEGGRQNLRDESIRIIESNGAAMHNWLARPHEKDEAWEKMLGVRLLDVSGMSGLSRRRSSKSEPAFEVHSVRVSRRQGPDGQELHQLVVQITQKRRGYFDTDRQREVDAADPRHVEDAPPDFWFRGGATVLVDLRDGRLRRVIRKRIDKKERLDRERAFRMGGVEILAMARRDSELPREPFAFMHRGR
jgi:hypothetical protein